MLPQLLRVPSPRMNSRNHNRLPKHIESLSIIIRGSGLIQLDLSGHASNLLLLLHFLHPGFAIRSRGGVFRADQIRRARDGFALYTSNALRHLEIMKLMSDTRECDIVTSEFIDAGAEDLSGA